jgi:hypothetical protein
LGIGVVVYVVLLMGWDLGGDYLQNLAVLMFFIEAIGFLVIDEEFIRA